jgi:hypothetical protein
MPVTYNTEQTIEVKCDGCDSTVRETLTGDDVFRGRNGVQVAHVAGWITATTEVWFPSGDELRCKITACSIPCAQASLGAFLREHAPAPKPEPTPSALFPR